MKQTLKWLSFALCALSPVVCQAQKFAQLECTHPDGYVYLYSSITTMEIRARLKCGQQVRIVGRYDNFFDVSTDDGQTGFVAASDLKILKSATSGATSARSKGKQPSRTGGLTAENAAHAPAPPPEIVLPNQTVVHLKLGKTLSSATAKVGEEVNFEVTQDVVVRGVTIIPKGAPATGAVTEAEPKRRMGHGGKLSVSVTYVRLANNEKAPLRSFEEEKGSNQKVGMVVPFMKGKDVTLAQDTEVTAYVSGDLHLKASDFAAARKFSTAASKTAPQ